MTRFLILAAGLLLSACCVCRKMPAPEKSDSARTVVKERVVIRPDTVYISVPVEDKSQIARDSSHLETSFATSDASIDSAGLLHHSLTNKPQNIPAKVETKIVYRDSLVYRDRQVKIPYPVEKELTWWQQTKLRGFWALLAVLVVVFRKPLFAPVRRFI